MAKRKSVVLDSKDEKAEADLCREVEGEQCFSLSEAESESISREDAIRSAAYALYEKRNGIGGSAEQDWLQAEAQLAQIASSSI